MAVARVQSNIKQAAFASSWTIAFSTQATTAGSLLVLVIASWAGGATVSAVSDPVNSAWTQLGSVSSLVSANTQVWYKLNAASITTAQNVTATSTSGDKAGVLIEYSGVATSAATDPASYTTTGNGSAASTSVTTGSITTGTANDVYIAAAAGDGATCTWTAPTTPWGFVQQSGNASFITIAVEDRINNDAAGTFSQTIVSNVSDNKAAKLGAFIPAAGAADPFPAGYRLGRFQPPNRQTLFAR